MHHDNPADVLNNDSIWFSGTRAHCLYSTPAIIMTVFVHRLTKNNHILHFQVLSLVLGYLSIRNHIICHASHRGYELDFLTILSHKLYIFPSPEYHSAHHQHLNLEGEPTQNIDECVSCNLYKRESKDFSAVKSSELVHHKNWAFFMPYVSKYTLEYIYLNLFHGPNSQIGYRFVMFLTIISYPAFSPLWFPFLTKN